MGKQSTRENKTIYQLCQEEKERLKNRNKHILIIFLIVRTNISVYSIGIIKLTIYLFS